MEIPTIEITTDQLEELRKRRTIYGGCEADVLRQGDTAIKVFSLEKTVNCRGVNDYKALIDYRLRKHQKIDIIYQKDNLNNGIKPIEAYTYDDVLQAYLMSSSKKYETLWNVFAEARDYCLQKGINTDEYKLNYLRKIRAKQEHFLDQDIFFGDLKADNILIDNQTGEVAFCDLDGTAVGDFAMELVPFYVSKLSDYLGYSEKEITIYNHNLLTVSEFYKNGLPFNHVLKEAEALADNLNGPVKRLVKEVGHPTVNFSGEYLIDYLR